MPTRPSSTHTMPASPIIPAPPSRNGLRTLLLIMLFVQWSVIGSGCGSRPSPVQRLSEAQQAEVRAALHSVAAGHEVTQRPRPAPPETGGVRWSDVHAAAASALTEIEAALLRAHPPAGATEGWRFEFITVNERPGELIIRRGDDSTGDYDAAARIGLFHAPEHRDTAAEERLIRAFHEHLRLLGRIERFEE